MTGMAKQLLKGILEAASASTGNVVFEMNEGEVEGALRSVLSQGTNYAQPLVVFCVAIIQSALDSVNAKASSIEDALSTGFLALTALDALVCETAKTKAERTATNPHVPPAQINGQIATLAQGKLYAGLPKEMAPYVINLVISVLESTSTRLKSAEILLKQTSECLA